MNTLLFIDQCGSTLSNARHRRIRQRKAKQRISGNMLAAAPFIKIGAGSSIVAIRAETLIDTKEWSPDKERVPKQTRNTP